MMKLYRITETWGDGPDAETNTFLSFGESEDDLYLGDNDTAQEMSLDYVTSKELAEKLDEDAESANRHHLVGAYSDIRKFIITSTSKFILSDGVREDIAKQVLWEIAKVGAWL